MMGEHYTEHLEKALLETTKSHMKMVLTLEKVMEELERCRDDLFEAEDKFHVLSFYIDDPQALECAKSRVKRMYESAQRVKDFIVEIKK